MLYTNRTRRIWAILTLIGLLLGGCAGSGDEKADHANTEQSIGESDHAEAREDAKVLMSQAAPWLPGDAVVVGGMTAERFWELSHEFFPDDRVNIEGEKPGTPAGMRADLGALMLDRMGADLTALEGMAFGATQDSVSVVLFGDIPLDEQRIDTEDVDGRAVMSISPGESTDVAPGSQKLWMTAIEEPRVGLAVFVKREHLVDALKARKSAEDVESPAQLGTPLYSDLPSGSFVAVAHLDERIKRQLGGMPVPPPDRLGLSFGDKMTMHLEGSSQSLDGISQIVSRYRSMAGTQLDRFYQLADDAEVSRAYGAIVAYHYGTAYLESFDEARADGRLTYTLSMPDSRAGFVAPAVLAAIAIPAFIKYTKRSKTSEASAITRRMSDGAKAYFQSDQTGCKGVSDCASPWHDSTQAGMPLRFEDKTFPGGTNYRLVTHTQVPSNGNKLPADPTATDGAAAPSKVLDALMLSFDDPTYFRYVYETGPGTGVDATAEIYAEADFDGSGEPNHRLRITLEVDPSSQSVRVNPAFTVNEFQ